MNLTDLLSISDVNQKVKQFLTWFIKEILRGDWLSKFVFLLVVVGLCGYPGFLAKLPFLQLWHASPQYWLVYLSLVGLLFFISVIIAARTIPRFAQPLPQPDVLAVRGLLPFNEQDSELFSQLGRRSELQRILAAIADPNYRLGLLVGPSGSGKTSFLRAGVLSKLRAKDLSACYIELSNEDPMVTISRALAALGSEKAARVLLLDQFEQFFLHQSEQQRKPLIEKMREWYRRDSQTHVLIAIRAEDLWRMEEVQRSLEYELTTSNYFTLSKFGLDQAIEVLRVLCEPAGIQFDPSFAREIVERDFVDSDDGLVSPVTIGIVIHVIASGNRRFTSEGFGARQNTEGVLDEWLHTQLRAAEGTILGQTPIKILSSLCDFDHQRRAGIFSVDAIVGRLGGDLSLKQVQLVLEWATRPDVRLVIRVETTADVQYQLTHERLIPAIRKAAGKLLNDADRANQLLDRRTNDWVANNRTKRFLLSLWEYWRIRAQWPYLIWGINRTDKELLLRRSLVRLRRRFASYAAVLLLLMSTWPIWTSDFIQRRYLPTELRALTTNFASPQAAHALASLGDLDAAKDVTDRVQNVYLEDDDQYRAEAETAAMAANAALATRNDPLLQKCIAFVQDRGDLGDDSLAAIATDMVKVARIRGDDSLSAKGLNLLGVIDAGEYHGRLDAMALEATKTALVRNDKKLLDFALGLAERTDTKKETVAAVIVELVKAGRVDLARSVADIQDSKPEHDSKSKSDALTGLALELARIDRVDEALAVARSLVP